MRGAEVTAVRRSRQSWRTLLFVSTAAASLLTGSAPAFGQVDYTGVPPVPPVPDVYVVDTYVGTYAGTPPGAAPPVAAGIRPAAPPLGGSDGRTSVAGAALGEAPEPLVEGDRRVVTGWDLVTMTALGLTGLVAFAISAARFRSP